MPVSASDELWASMSVQLEALQRQQGQDRRELTALLSGEARPPAGARASGLIADT